MSRWLLFSASLIFSRAFHEAFGFNVWKHGFFLACCVVAEGFIQASSSDEDEELLVGGGRRGGISQMGGLRAHSGKCFERFFCVL
jgi:hypothetical protein